MRQRTSGMPTLRETTQPESRCSSRDNRRSARLEKPCRSVSRHCPTNHRAERSSSALFLGLAKTLLVLGVSDSFCEGFAIPRIPAPFPQISVHIVKPKPVYLFAPHRLDFPFGIPIEPSRFIQRRSPSPFSYSVCAPPPQANSHCASLGNPANPSSFTKPVTFIHSLNPRASYQGDRIHREDFRRIVVETVL